MTNCLARLCVVLLFCSLPSLPASGSALWGQNTPADTHIEKGPYLIYPGHNSQMMVLWQVNKTSPCSINWGTTIACETGQATTTEYGKDHQHKYTILNLLPATKYYYRVTVGPDNYTGTFVSAPSPDAKNVTFLAYGDTRSNPADQDQVCARMIEAYRDDPACQSFVLHAGDWASSNSEKDWQSEFFNRSFFKNLALQANLPIAGTTGNHEGSGKVYAKYWPYPYVADRYWSFDYGPVHVAVLDQYTDYHKGSAQLNWLENDLRTSSKPWKIILLHEPGWSGAKGHSDNAAVRTLIQPLCQRYGVKLVICGHNHYYCRAVVNGVHHVTTGGGGAPIIAPRLNAEYVLAASASPHFCKISITGNTLYFDAIKSDGSVIESFTITQ